MLRNARVVLAMALLTGCPPPPGFGGTGGGAAGGEGGGGGPGGGAAGTGGGVGGTGGGAETFAVSSKAQLRFKRNERLANEIAAGLGLAPGAVCNELGLYPCATLVHPLPLGGVDAYNIGLYEPVARTGLTSPIVVDRIALAACTQRVINDLQTPATAVVFKGVTLDAAGKLDIESPEVSASLDVLYERILLRPPTAAEVGHLKGLYADVVATAKPEPGRAWMMLSCFAVVSSVESLFY